MGWLLSHSSENNLYMCEVMSKQLLLYGITKPRQGMWHGESTNQSSFMRQEVSGPLSWDVQIYETNTLPLETNNLLQKQFYIVELR